MGFGLFFLLVFLVIILTNCLTTLDYFLTGVFCLDMVGVYLSIISLVFTITFSFLCKNIISISELFCLGVSLISSVICFLANNSILFWVSYEMTIIPLVCCILVSSPYSERFLASWYLLFYILLTSLPMLLIIVYLSMGNGSYAISDWHIGNDFKLVNFILFVLFITKVPLPPFHSWLPVVHAEASTFTSIVLSGYVMKLGIIGLVRFCGSTLTDLLVVIGFMFGFSLLFFVASFCELDNKRWLAFLSLSHIMVSIIGIYTCPGDMLLSLVYCVGHGMSAGLLFYSFMCLYNNSGSRNWVLIAVNDNSSISWRILIVLGLLSVASLPPSMTFITELCILGYSQMNLYVTAIYSFYLLMGGVIPMLLMSYILCNSTVKSINVESVGLAIVNVLSLYVVWFVGGLF